MTRLSTTPEWQHLAELAKTPLPHLRELLQMPGRVEAMKLESAGLIYDFSRQRLTPAIQIALNALARAANVEGQRADMAQGKPINATENRPVLHMALRGSQMQNPPWGQSVSDEINAELPRMNAFAEKVRTGQLKGFDGQTITDIVNIGIGGSDLGPRMAVEALSEFAIPTLRFHFVSNPDPVQLAQVFNVAQPGRTLFLVSSKTFTTQDTMTNASSARQWLLDKGCSEKDLSKHLVAITANPAKSQSMGYAPEMTFKFWNWVGGRYSMWSAIGLPILLAVGQTQFRAFLDGAHAMDKHFLEAPIEKNIPIQMALIGIWNRNFLGASSQCVTPYVSPLAKLPAYLQQQDMESNGKRITCDNEVVDYGTGPIIWGGLGIDGQHAYFQLIHQGTHLIPVDMIGARRTNAKLPKAQDHHNVVLANLVAQAGALSMGRTVEETREGLKANGLSDADITRLEKHRSFPGNVPVSLLWMETLTPAILGALVALYEHKVFVQAAIWRTYAYDQWGVELGKSMVDINYPSLSNKTIPAQADPATRATLGYLLA